MGASCRRVPGSSFWLVGSSLSLASSRQLSWERGEGGWSFGRFGKWAAGVGGSWGEFGVRVWVCRWRLGGLETWRLGGSSPFRATKETQRWLFPSHRRSCCSEARCRWRRGQQRVWDWGGLRLGLRLRLPLPLQLDCNSTATATATRLRQLQRPGFVPPRLVGKWLATVRQSCVVSVCFAAVRAQAAGNKAASNLPTTDAKGEMTGCELQRQRNTEATPTAVQIWICMLP